ncbi:MAG: PH domain-containing protein [Bacteroidaceae bacterium]|nr:PH domain-containing protein [Bacteroidaceae bacterium]
MANYIKQSLEEGETIIFKGRLHWSYIFRYLFFSLLFLVGGIVVIYLAYYKYPEQKTALFYTGIAFLVLAFFIWIVGRIVRTRSEFAVTDTRFVQKDGIFNIKMTEIPLARIETVNFYQSFWQRLLGTGCVEMVGSGGTSHQVHCIEQPMKVRKIICASIKKPMPTNSASDTSSTSMTSSTSTPNNPSLSEQQ